MLHSPLSSSLYTMISDAVICRISKAMSYRRAWSGLSHCKLTRKLTPFLQPGYQCCPCFATHQPLTPVSKDTVCPLQPLCEVSNLTSALQRPGRGLSPACRTVCCPCALSCLSKSLSEWAGRAVSPPQPVAPWPEAIPPSHTRWVRQRLDLPLYLEGPHVSSHHIWGPERL